MVFKPFQNEVLGELCSQDQLELLDAIDRLRSQGIDHYISLPQIIVCGDQSSGKSSVLEAISGVSFPVKGNLCTRFPTELILRTSPNVDISVSIVPDHSHSELKLAALRNFRENLDDFDKLPDLIETAKKAMEIGRFGQAFSKDLLRIEVSGPDRPHLTIVDLPGLIHSETKQQSASDVELVQEVVKSYMKEPRSIILAVVSAKNDYANQIVLKLARTADKSGSRTLGVITKPDTLIPESESEASYISLAQNHEIEFRLGWHVLKNLDSETLDSEAQSNRLLRRDEQERVFFSRGKWDTVPKFILGIALLRERLSKLLLAQIAKELPSLIEEIETQYNTCRDELHKLGQPRANIEEQRRWLLTLSQTSQSLTKAAMDGTYNHPFFGDAKTDAGYEKRIRAVVQNLNQSFAEDIASEGHRYVVTKTFSESIAAARDSKAEPITRAKMLDRIGELLKRTRGRELPGTFNPMVVSDLFYEQSEPWDRLARSHIDKVARAVKCFLKHLIIHLTDASTCNPLFRGMIEPALEAIVKDLKDKTTDLLAPHQRGHPITYNDQFVETIREVRNERMESEFTGVIQNFFRITHLQHRGVQEYEDQDFRPLLDALMACSEPNKNQYACSEALDCMQAYYKVALKRFVDDIAVEAIEKNIIVKLGDILSPIKVTYMPDDEVTSVAGESEESRARRKQLENQVDVLVSGADTCKRFMGVRLQGLPEASARNDASKSWSPSLSALSIIDELNDTLDEQSSFEPLEEQVSMDTDIIPEKRPGKKAKKGKKNKRTESAFSALAALDASE